LVSHDLGPEPACGAPQCSPWRSCSLRLPPAPAQPAAGAQQEFGGTSETFTDVREDGSYFDPSLGRRVHITPSVTIVEPSEFDWADAGVGAAGAFGLVLLASGVVLIFATQRRRAA
jgi:hypothetical protein